MCHDAAPDDLYTEKQRAYVASLPDDPEILKDHLLHQIRLRDNLRGDRDKFETHNNSLSERLTIARKVIEQLQPGTSSSPIRRTSQRLAQMRDVLRKNGWVINEVDDLHGTIAEVELDDVLRTRKLTRIQELINAVDTYGTPYVGIDVLDVVLEQLEIAYRTYGWSYSPDPLWLL